MTRLTALLYVTEVLAKLITFNKRVKQKNTEGKNSELEKTDVTIRPGSKSKKGRKLTST